MKNNLVHRPDSPIQKLFSALFSSDRAGGKKALAQAGHVINYF